MINMGAKWENISIAASRAFLKHRQMLDFVVANVIIVICTAILVKKVKHSFSAIAIIFNRITYNYKEIYSLNLYLKILFIIRFMLLAWHIMLKLITDLDPIPTRSISFKYIIWVNETAYWNANELLNVHIPLRISYLEVFGGR